jgi:hypothetical protein
MTMTVKVGKGYSLAEHNKDEDAPIGTIPIDAVFHRSNAWSTWWATPASGSAPTTTS